MKMRKQKSDKEKNIEKVMIIQKRENNSVLKKWWSIENSDKKEVYSSEFVTPVVAPGVSVIYCGDW